jgi:hypothetical protein
VKIAAAKFKKYKSPSSDQILAELLQAGGKTLLRFINSLIPFGIVKNFQIRWKESIILPVSKKSDKTDCNNCHGISLVSTSYRML